MKGSINELYALEALAGGNTFVHRLDPKVKILTTLGFIIVVVSFDRYAFDRLAPYVFYPTLLMAFSETPYVMLLKRFMIALPFCILVGASNIFFDGIYGFVALLTILLRAYLCVMAVLVLVSVTPLSELTGAMRKLKAPSVFVTMFEMTYRYIGLLFDEARSMYIAYTLRSGGKGIRIGHMGSFTGQLLLRGFDRAERVYNAMKCRGYPLVVASGMRGARLTRLDYAFIAVNWTFFAVLRIWRLM